MNALLVLAFGLLLLSFSHAGDTARNDMGDDLPDVVYTDELCCAGFAVLPAVLLLSARARSSYGKSR
ncbi:hypothetical protein JW721_06315 [Candidatus Micrarchaeota archaeon]|nr:hypothetical protein [Candidatus Micrarchaeota archaeon]